MTYVVYCEFYGSKKKIKVMSESTAQAKKVVTDSIVFHKMIKEEPEDDTVRNLMDILGMKGK